MPKTELHLPSFAKAAEMLLKDRERVILVKRKQISATPHAAAVLTIEAKVHRGAFKSKMYEHYIYYSEQRDMSQVRFDIAHEIGHILLHRHHQRRKDVARMETEAEFFASSLLKKYSLPSPKASCFFSYSVADELFASRLYKDLKKHGIKCWKYDQDAKVGQKLWREIDKAIRGNDKVLLIASKNSLQSPYVIREIERAIRLEDERILAQKKKQFDGDVNVLLPINLDNYIFQKWNNERKTDVISKMIADATGWETRATVYKNVLNRLIQDLKKNTQGEYS
jgi:hypothetical protein